MDNVTSLFAPLQVKQKILRNRLVMPPMVVNRGLTTLTGWQWYGRRAAGGVGLVIVEATDIVHFGTEYTADTLRPLVEAIHQGGALAAIQLFPGKRGQKISPAQLTTEQIQQLLTQYHLAAEICGAAGFDGIEPHGAHGFLLNQFFSPVQNQRTDNYGGDLANRMRLALDILEIVRPIAVRMDMLILYRHTPVGQGYGIEESLVLARALMKTGVDILDISPASDARPADRAAPFMQLGLPVIAVNELDRLPRALEVLREKRATLVAVGRGLIADPDWPSKVREGRLEEITACTGCDQCFDDLDRDIPVGCSQWN
jgi:2,4-dienoyl-CoA reductase-like NADH-dependent reductase (Old Yellow Enzyme family)